MNHSIQIRPAVSTDTDELASLVRAFRIEHSRMIGGHQNPEPVEIRQQIEEDIAGGAKGYLLACFEEGKIAGYRLWESHDGYHQCHELFVLPEFRRQGIARKLIAHFEAMLKELDQAVATVSVVPHNIEMIELLFKSGYEILNMIEFRKNLSDDALKPRSEIEALGKKWKKL